MQAQRLIAAAREAGRSALDEAAGKALLASYGVAVPRTAVATAVDDAERALQGLKLPVVVKVISPDILHKSDAGGVRVGLRSADEVRAAISSMAALPAISGARLEG